MRHAKSSWKDAQLNDMERPLLQKGLERTRLIISYLRENGFNPEYVLTSPAVRALETARIMAHAFDIGEKNFREEKNIYSANENSYYDLCFDLPKKISHLLIVGHNPALTGFVNFFLNPRIDYLPTSGIVSIEFDSEKWEEVPVSSYRVRFMIFPKMMG